MFKPRKYLSGAAKRKRRKEKDKSLARGKRTLEDLGWGIKKLRADLIDETEIATDDGEPSMDEGSSQNTVTAETASTSSNSNDTDSVVSISSNMVSFCTSDPATWRQLSAADRESIAHNGPPEIPSSFPHDTKDVCFQRAYLQKHCLMVRQFVEIG